MKVKVVKEYFDRELDKYPPLNSELDVKEDRAKKMIYEKVAVEIKEEKKAEEPKKK